MVRSVYSGALAALFLLFSMCSVQAQNRFEISAGAGLFEGGFLKAKYGNRIEIGLSQDFVSQLHTTGLEVYFRIPRKHEPALPGPFYIMSGVSTTLFGKGYDTFEQTFIYPRIGRSFLFRRKTGRAGLNADIGFVIHRHTDPPAGYLTEVIPISCSTGFFYRF